MAHHPLELMLLNDGLWNENFYWIWLLGQPKIFKTRVVSDHVIDSLDLTDVCDKFKSILDGMPVLRKDGEIGIHHISLPYAVQYMKGIAMLYKRKASKAMDSACSLLDLAKWKPFFTMDTKPQSASQVNVPKKAMNFKSFDLMDFSEDAISAFKDTDWRPEILVMAQSDWNVSLATLFSMKDEEIEDRLKKITLIDDIKVESLSPTQLSADPPVDDIGNGDGPIIPLPPEIRNTFTEIPLPPEIRNTFTEIPHPPEIRNTSTEILNSSKEIPNPPAETEITKIPSTPSCAELCTDEDYEEMLRKFNEEYDRRQDMPQKKNGEPLRCLWDMSELDGTNLNKLTTLQELLKEHIEVNGLEDVLRNRNGVNDTNPPDVSTETQRSPQKGPVDVGINTSVHTRDPSELVLIENETTTLDSTMQLRKPQINKKQVLPVNPFHLTEQQRKTYQVDPTNADNVLAFLKLRLKDVKSLTVYEIAPPNVWHPIHMTMLIQQLLDLATREYIMLTPFESTFTVTVL